MKRNLKLALMSTVIFTSSSNAQSDLETAAGKLNKAAADGQRIINGTQNTINTVDGVIQQGKAIKETASTIIGLFGKKKNKNK